MNTKQLSLISMALVATSVLAADPSGWRVDGTGRFPNADIPTTWSATENVIWKKELPDRSNASPIVIGDKIFICIEPTTLACLSTKDGSILWKKDNAYADVLTADEVTSNKEADKSIGALMKTSKTLRKQKKQLENNLKNDAQNAELKERLKKISKEGKKVNEQLKKLEIHASPRKHKVTGNSSPTPVSDGQHVYVLYGTGIAACYDLSGNRVWARIVEKPTHGWGHCISPLLIGDTLIMHVRNVYGLNKKTGAEKWKHPSEARWGSPIKARVGENDYAVTANGEILDPKDGKDLTGKLFKLAYNSPMVEGNVLYFVQAKGKAFELPDTLDADNKPKELWKTGLKGDRFYASPVYHNGLIYAIVRGRTMSVLDAKDGTVLYSKKLAFKGTPYPSMILLGDKICVSSDDGTSIIVEPGREYKELAVNKLEPFRSCPVVAQNRMYIRTLKHLYCIGK